ncbi:hypothetical protein HELRODRAFT_82429 [Helobdella robusta]|uniref:VWFA domain-containing protein n=1 Tax=Helobdella robusta TaxID=6412 RepID=T1G4S0_HELRO|nr:hypothetical protein HELRODRAFT_82429 [Helobdella robusta]ESO00908.1 hypothetical protein HELRODRAFT_82429 [Helobdella robusta]
MAHQLLIIVSDGRIQENVGRVKPYVKLATERGIFIVFIIVDTKSSILSIRNPIVDERQQIRLEPYMDSFPFPYYVIIRDVTNIPQTMADALRQWFELVGQK